MFTWHDPDLLSIPLTNQMCLATTAFWIFVWNASAVIIKKLTWMCHYFLVYELASWVKDTNMIDLSLDFSLKCVSEVVILHSVAFGFQKLNYFPQINMLWHLGHEVLLPNDKKSFKMHLLFMTFLTGITITITLIFFILFFQSLYLLFYFKKTLNCVHPQLLVFRFRQSGPILVADFNYRLNQTIKSLHWFTCTQWILKLNILFKRNCDH